MDLGQATIKDAESIETAQQRKAYSKSMKDRDSKDTIISVIRWVGWLIVICGAIFASQFLALAKVFLFAGVVAGILIVAAAEGLDLLQKIYLNTKNKL
jgi:hypothetical protein